MKLTSQTLYKWTGPDGACTHSPAAPWSLPNGKPGKWRAAKGKLLPCSNGIHLCREADLVDWCAPELYAAEYTGGMVEESNKIVVRRARLIERIDTWNERTARLFACDCAEHVFRDDADPRIREAIVVARRFANGEATREELTAAWAAARDAARAARDAAWAAWSAARDAARDAAWSAARAAAWDAAWSAARDAASAAARAAARDAASAASAAAARDAAGAAAWSAERKWQTTRLMQYLRGEVMDD